MQNKINVAELLRKCPEGMELDCTLFNRPLKYSGFEGFQDAYPIRTVAENGEIIWFTKEGCAHNNMYSKCVIFPKGKTSWEGFIPPCTFKKGDVLISQAGNMVLFSHINSENLVYYHCIIPIHGSFRIAKNPSAGVGEYHRCILANEHQKQRMYDEIKSAGYKYNQDTNKLEKLPEFKDGDICYIKTKDNEHIFIFNDIDKYGMIKRYANLTKHGFYKDNVNVVCNESVIEEFRYATEEEKDRLFKSIKDHGYMWNPEKKCLEKLPRFKDGDVVATHSGTWIGIVEKQESDIAMTTHCVLKDTGDFEAYLEEKGRWCFSRLATEDEKQRLFKVIEDNGYKWDAERKTLERIIKPKFKVGDTIKEVQGNKKGTIIEFYDSGFYVVKRDKGFTSYINIKHQDHWELFIDKFDINTLKPFEQVLVRDTIDDKWHIQFFEKYNNTQHFPFKCILSEYKQCVPYKGNEHLLDTKDECIDYYKTWE